MINLKINTSYQRNKLYYLLNHHLLNILEINTKPCKKYTNNTENNIKYVYFSIKSRCFGKYLYILPTCLIFQYI